MQTYNLDQDFSTERGTSLRILHLVTLAVGLIVFAANGARYSPYLLLWLTLLGTLVLSHVLLQRNQTSYSAWVYMVGLSLAFSLSLWNDGPSTNNYFLMLVPVALSVILVEREGTVKIAVACIGLMFITTMSGNNVLPVLGQSLIPALVVAVLAGLTYVNSGSALEMIYWALDIQKKDAERAETFYEQKEQLTTALRELTHAHSSLELMNVRLAESQKQTERASQAKSLFLSNMSHELRTPLNVIIGYTSSMLDMPEIYDNLSLAPVHERDIRIVKDSGYYLLGLINDILDLSKIEAGKLELHYNPVNLTQEFKGILSTTIGLVKDKPIQIRPDFPEDLPFVWADPVRMRQILLNLMSNAVKFTETGSVTLHAHVEGDRVCVSVMDTGIGIAENALEHIFDRFQQADSDTEVHYGGTGLGLDISKQLARMHGGDLTVQSTVGKGSVFSFTLSLANETQIQQPSVFDNVSGSVKTLTPPVGPIAYTVLLVEDEASMRDMMRRTLESMDYNVVDIQDGAQVLEMATGLLPDLIILDVRLPNVDGWELLSSLKHNPDTASIPVVVCTVNEDGERATELGAALYLRKPFSPDEFLAYTQELLPNSLQANEGNLV